mmetsp:Transcript_25916/g.80862  ORF Transcript_25916/g.80862 Transcript_25916/m.80862 type:complete len:567 (+) Transcript_25916:121-1821(+)
MTNGEKCPLCQAGYSPVWRKHKATGVRICNRCYRKLPSDLGGFSAEGGLFDDASDAAAPPRVGEDAPEAGAGEDRGRRKRKHQDRGHGEGGMAGDGAPPEDMDLSTPAVDTDSEYADIDLEESPKQVHVRDSGKQKIEGTYRRLSKPSRGRPCYAKWMEKKPMYLFWNKKWIIGWDFGSAKSYAKLTDAGKLSPCEPYPKVWKVLDKGDKDKHADANDDGKTLRYVDNLPMRVVDDAVLALSLRDESLVEFDVPDSGEAQSRHRKKEAKRTREPSSAGKEKTAAAAGAEGAAAAPGARGTGEDAGAKPGSGGEDLGPADGNSDQESESSSEESSSSASASERPPPQQEAVLEATPLAARRAKESPDMKAQEFEAKLRDQLLRLPTLEARKKKFMTVKEMLMKRTTGVDGVAPEKLQVLLAKVQNWLMQPMSGGPSAAGMPPPAGPPPPAFMAAAAAEAGRASVPDAAPQQAGAPFTRSALRRPGAPRQRSRRISFCDGAGWQLASETPVLSYRGCGEQLWFQMPGAVVVCDSCEREVLQSMGSLQGAPSQSQFAQSKFLCADCSGM